MRSFVCFLVVLQMTMGQIQNVYDAQSCGISQISDPTQSSLEKRVRRSSDDAQSINQTTNGDVPHEDLDENAVLGDDDDFMQEKVMGGRRAARGELPWAVYLITPGDFCAGTLVSRRHVITAAHCFWASNKKMGRCNISDTYSMEAVINSTKVFVGGSCLVPNISIGCNMSDVGKMYKVARASYEQYFAFNCKGTHDIAILELTEDVPKTINHVCLPFLHQLEEIEDPYLNLRSFGWGLDPLKFPGSPSPYLQIAELGVKLSEEKCNKKKMWNSNDTFCTKSGPQYICGGDSGGGVTATIRKRTYLMGINSFGPECNRVAKGINISHPQVSTDIMYYKEVIKSWIQTPKSEQSIAIYKTTWRSPVTNLPRYTTTPPQPVADKNWKAQYPYGSQVSNPPTNNPNPSQPVIDQNWKAQYPYGNQVLNPPTNIPNPQTVIDQNWRAQYPYGSQVLNPPTNIPNPFQTVTDQNWGAQYPYSSQVSNPPTNIPSPQTVIDQNWGAQYPYGSRVSNPSTNIPNPSQTVIDQNWGAQYPYSSQVNIPNPSQPVIDQNWKATYPYGNQVLNPPTNIPNPSQTVIDQNWGAQYPYGSQVSNPPTNIPNPSQTVIDQNWKAQYPYGSQASNPPSNINYPQSQPDQEWEVWQPFGKYFIVITPN